jgi:L-fuconolactonase
MLQDLSDDAYILRPRVIDNLRHLESLDLPFDILTFPRHLPHVLKALDRAPTLPAVVDHISKPPISEGKLDGWAANMTALAAHRNIRCKLSGMVTEADHVSWRPADLEPFVRRVFDAFSEDRVMFGSDWPVCLQAASYAEVLKALHSILDRRLSADGFDKVFGQNAVEFYKLKVEPCNPASR